MLREPNADVELIDWPSVSYQHRLRDERVAIAVLDMLVNSQKWMHRRLETVTFVTDTTIRRHIGLDISIPPAAPDVEGPAARRRLVPLTMVRKHRLVHVDLRTGDGRPLPYLNVRQNQALAETMLLTWAREVLGGAHLGRDIEADLRAVVSGRGPDLLDAMRLFATQSGPLGRKRAALWRAPEFRLLFHQLANDFILLALVDEEPTRQIVELEYEDSLHLDGLVSVFRRAHHRNVSPGARTRLAWRVTRSTIGWRPSDVRFTLPAAGDAETFHLEVEAPPGTYARDAVLLARDPTGSRPPPDGDDARNQWDREGGRTRVDLRVADVRPGDVVDARVSLAAVRRGWLSHAALAAIASTVVLGIGLAARWDAVVRGDRLVPELTAAGMLALAAILATVLVRPPEHPLAARLLSLVRAFAVVPLAMLFLAGVALMLVPEWLTHPWVSIAGFALAAAGALVVVVGWLLARSPDPGRLPSQHAEGPNAAREEERARAELARSNEWNLPDVGAAGSSEGDRYVFYLPPEHHAVGVEVRWTDADQRRLESRLARLKRRL